ncbi:MMPL family transporter [Tundrisphaera lichenicola]|uniref:MMPL family transporter n=1 Tax=Tundrisphaera lichenicola TaxID=2029860 RepID=UPI003EBFB08C
MFHSLARLVNTRGWIIIAGWVVVTAILFLIAPKWESVTKDDDVNFFPAGYPSVIGQSLLNRGFPKDAASSQAVLIAERSDGKLTRADYNHVVALSQALTQLKRDDPSIGIKQVVDYRVPILGPRLIGGSSDGKGEATLVLVSLNGTYIAKQTRIAMDRLQVLVAGFEKPPVGLRLEMTGSAAVGHDMNRAAIASVSQTTWATILLVVVILLIVYKSPLLALLPLLTIALSVQVSLKAIASLTLIPGLQFQVINITNIFVIVVLFGAGTDYCLFLIARYREELARGRSGPEALREAIEQVGGALVASAGTVIVGLGMLWFSSFAKIQYTGPAIALSLAIGLLAALTLAPVLLHWLRGAVFFPFVPPHHEKGGDPDEESLAQIPLSVTWGKIASVVIRKPGLILSVSIAALIPFAILGARTTSNYSQLTDLSPDQPSIIGSKLVRKYFAAGELGPTTVLFEHPGINFRSDKGRGAIEQLSKSLAALDRVSEVRSISRPLGVSPESFQERIADMVRRPFVDPRYVSTDPANPADLDHITRLDLIFKADPFSADSLRTLQEVRRVIEEASRPGGPLDGLKATGLSGSTAMVADLKEVTTKDEQRMYWLVTLGVYVILVLLLRRPWICLYLIATVVLGYLASLGITELFFRAIHDGPDPWVGLDWKVSFFLFVILVAVGEDYNIFLMARVIEEEKKHGPIEGTRQAVMHTGGIISSCGLIMAGTFGSMITGSLTALKELGFALGLGVLLDTFIVRPILVPAFVVLIHRFKARQGTDNEPIVHDPAEVTSSTTP